MENLKKIKIITICAFLLINIPGDHISPFLFMLIPFLLLNYLCETLTFGKDFIVDLLDFLLIILLTLSFFKIFKTKKIIVLFSLIIQYVFLIYMFKINYLKYWHYYIPASIYLILSLFIILSLFVLKPKNTDIKNN